MEHIVLNPEEEETVDSTSDAFQIQDMQVKKGWWLKILVFDKHKSLFVPLFSDMLSRAHNLNHLGSDYLRASLDLRVLRACRALPRL